MSIEANDINKRWMEKKSYNMHEDEHKFSSCMRRCVEKESEDLVARIRNSSSEVEHEEL